MARSSAAQEPSMEEILASIRKIIESGDDRPENSEAGAAARIAPSVAFRDVEPDAKPDAGSSEPPAETDLEQVAGPSPVSDEVEAFLDSDFTDLKLELEQEFASVTNEPAMIVAPLRASSVSPQFQPAPLAETIERTAAEWPLRSDGRHAALRAAAAVAGDRQAARPADPLFTPAPAPAPSLEEEAALSGPLHRPANSDDPRMRDFREAILRDSERAPGPRAEPLISSRSGDLVSASFEELDRAIREGQLRSMEQMAEEMMRPLLQEWLDDNLPRIVERLVREEIERVARGGR